MKTEIETFELTPLEQAVHEAGIEAKAAASLRQTFEELFDQAEKWREAAAKIVVKDGDDREGITKARNARLALKAIRVNGEKTRKKLKEESLRTGKAIDAVANVLKFLIVPIENRLDDQEKIAERQAEAKRAAILEDRRVAINVAGLAAYHTAESFASLDDDQFAESIAALKLSNEQREKREAEEAARDAAEKERLIAEAAEANKKAAEEAEARRKEKAEADAKLVEERRERLKEQARAETILVAERAKREKAEQAERERKQAEARAEQDRRDAERKAAAAPDKEKLKAFKVQIELVAFPLPDMTTDAGFAAIHEIDCALENLTDVIAEQISKL